MVMMEEVEEEELEEVEEVDGHDATTGADPFVQLAFVHGALDDYLGSDLSQLDDEWLGQLVTSLERVKVRVEAATSDVLAEAARRTSVRDHGFSGRSFVAHHGRLSGPEGLARRRVAAVLELLPDWAGAARSGRTNLGDDHLRLMSRVATNPRIRDAVVDHQSALLDDAETMSFEAFERRLRDFERSVDVDGARRASDRALDRRDVQMRQQPDRSWRLTARFGSVQGAEINDILAHFNDAEFRSDWSGAVDRLGDATTFRDLDRTEPQRRADALTAALLRAASSPGHGRAPLPCLNVLIDERTLEAVLTGRPLDPAASRTMVCRTDNGDPIDVTEAAALTLYATVRRVVHDGAGVITDLGRRSRVFRGANRQAATLLTDRCVWPGCDRQLRSCQVDHAVSWMQHGTTDPDNGAVMCGRHNRLKHRGRFRAIRRADGEWEILDADHDPIG